MEMKWENKLYDVVVVGAGFSGLATAIRLQQQGKFVLVLEKTDRPGGRAKKVTLGNFEFEVGCNQGGKSIEDMMNELGVKHLFIPMKNRFIFGNKGLEFPLTKDSPDTLPELSHLFVDSEDSNKTLEQVTSSLEDKTRVNILRALFAYFLMLPSEKIDLSLAKNFLINKYGYETPLIPAGGMSALIDSMVNRFQSLGGVIQCDASYEGFFIKDGLKIVSIRNGSGQSSQCQTKFVVSSVAGWSLYPENAERSLSVASLLFEMNADFHYPEDVHTIVFIPDDIDAWLRTTHQGILDDQFGFHCFKNQPLSTEEKSPCKISVYLLWPRDRKWNQADHEKIEARMISIMNQYLPGFQESIVKKHFFPPDAYIKSWGFESVVVPLIPPKGFTLPSYDAKSDIYYVGNAVNAQYEQHIGGALASAKNVAELINGFSFRHMGSEVLAETESEQDSEFTRFDI